MQNLYNLFTGSTQLPLEHSLKFTDMRNLSIVLVVGLISLFVHAQTVASTPVAVLGFKPSSVSEKGLFQEFRRELLFATDLTNQEQSIPNGDFTISVGTTAAGPKIENGAAKSVPPGISADDQVWGIFESSWFEPQAHIRRMTMAAHIADRIDLELAAAAASSADALTLADAMQAYLLETAQASQGSREVADVVNSAIVETAGTTVRVRLVISAAAMRLIRNNETSKALLHWKTGEETREQWQRVGDIIQALNIKTGSAVADIGAGDGFMTVRLARAVRAQGKVYAEDIDSKSLEIVQRRTRAGGQGWVRTIVGDAHDPRLPVNSVNAVLVVNAYHEFTDYPSMLQHIVAALKPRGRLVLVEPFSEQARNQPRQQQTSRHLIAPELLVQEVQQVGLKIVTRDDKFIDVAQGAKQSLVVAEKP